MQIDYSNRVHDIPKHYNLRKDGTKRDLGKEGITLDRREIVLTLHILQLRLDVMRDKYVDLSAVNVTVEAEEMDYRHRQIVELESLIEVLQSTGF